MKSWRTQNKTLFGADFWSRGIIRQFFFENEQGNAVIDNSDRYRAILYEFLLTKIKEEYIGNVWFQQDGATYHTAEATLDILRPVFEDHIINRRTDVIRPPRSCDLTTLDYYLWGTTVKDKSYADKTEAIDALKDIDEIQMHPNDNVLKNWIDREGYCMASQGSHLNETLFSIINRKEVAVV